MDTFGTFFSLSYYVEFLNTAVVLMASTQVWSGGDKPYNNFTDRFTMGNISFIKHELCVLKLYMHIVSCMQSQVPI